MLSERIDQELKDAARAQDKKRLSVLRMFKSQMKYREIELDKSLDDAEIVAVAQTMIKQRKDSVSQFDAGGRPELAAGEREEIVILEAYLPRQLSDDELSGLVQEAIGQSGAQGPKDMGKVMKAVQPKIAGRAEGRRVSDAVKAGLSKIGS